MRKFKKNCYFLFLEVFALHFLWGCSSATTSPELTEEDPWEPMNRAIFSMNQRTDQYVIKPLAQGYRMAVPKEGRNMVSNVFGVLKEPAHLLNALLQGELKDSGWVIVRTATNLTFGFFGLFDAATEMHIPSPNNDFGQTLAKWGWKSGGPYMVLPLLGPSNPRDTIGLGVDALTDVTHWEMRKDYPLLIGTFALNGISKREKALELSDNLENSTTDFYATMRTMYLQNRQKKLNQVIPQQENETPAYDVEFEIEDD